MNSQHATVEYATSNRANFTSSLDLVTTVIGSQHAGTTATSLLSFYCNSIKTSYHLFTISSMQSPSKIVSSAPAGDMDAISNDVLVCQAIATEVNEREDNSRGTRRTFASPGQGANVAGYWFVLLQPSLHYSQVDNRTGSVTAVVKQTTRRSILLDAGIVLIVNVVTAMFTLVSRACIRDFHGERTLGLVELIAVSSMLFNERL